MMTKTEHIAYWVQTAEEDWERSEYLFSKKDYVFGLFCVHLCLEKLAKALWVKENISNFPPRIHDIKYLLADTSISISGEQALILDNIQRYQIEGRYPDYRRLINSYTTKEYAFELKSNCTLIKKCLQEQISE